MLPNGLVELRALMSAADSASRLGPQVRRPRAPVTYIRENYPEALPRFRIETPETRAGVPWTGARDRSEAQRRFASSTPGAADRQARDGQRVQRLPDEQPRHHRGRPTG